MPMPKPGTRAYEDMVAFMRADIAIDFQYSSIIDVARKMVEAQGKNFDEEFKKWKEKGGVIHGTQRD